MAQKATIYKATISLSDMDRHYYDTLNITIPQHPSETDRRMMVRILAYILNAEQDLQFCKGLSDDDEPEIWLKDYSEQIHLWIELGQIDEKRIKKGCTRSKEMRLYSYGAVADVWWKKIQNKLSSFSNLTIYKIDEDTCAQLATLVDRTMDLQCSIDSGQIWLGNHDTTVQIDLETLLEPIN
ncbi:YaeQ family protein [Thalassotalea fonticola]|uniref:YaeQ family protein n=1 Tax=Thalassotalea fonticola TaxID=3065649 RepID=A0ABZ0GR03_9GAMM|nr:YaeQ family protein [Colwelliaceae bacterium S1-1]